MKSLFYDLDPNEKHLVEDTANNIHWMLQKYPKDGILNWNNGEANINAWYFDPILGFIRPLFLR